MTFQPHLEAVERKASAPLGSLMIVGKTEKISPVNMIKLRVTGCRVVQFADSYT